MTRSISTKQVVDDFTTQALRSEEDFDGTMTILTDQMAAWDKTYREYADNIEMRLDKFKDLNPDVQTWNFDIADLILVKDALTYCNNLILKILTTGTHIADDSVFTDPKLTDCGITYGKVYGDVSFKKFGWYSPITDPSTPRDVTLMKQFGGMDENHMDSYIYVYTTDERFSEESAAKWPKWAGFVPANFIRVVSTDWEHAMRIVQFGDSGLYYLGVDGPVILDTDEDVVVENLDLSYLANQLAAETPPRHLYQFDPDYDWFDTTARLKEVQRYLKMSKFFKGWFGTGKHGITKVIDDLTKYRTLREAKWFGPTPYRYALSVIKAARVFGDEDASELERMMKSLYATRDAVALFQVGNLFGVRHALIRVLTTQLYRFAAKAM